MAGKVFVSGDTHGAMGISRLGSRPFPQGKSLDKSDLVIILGDFGVPWVNPDVGADAYWLDWLEQKPWTTAFIDGNHENFDILDSLEAERWHGGTVQRLRPSVIHLMRGQVYEIAGRTFFTMGGADSVDKAYRLPHISWWEREMPSWEEYRQAELALDAVGWQVDYALTHTCPANFMHAINPAFTNDELTRFLFDVERRLRYGAWLFGHHHVDLDLRPKGYNARCVYQDILELGGLESVE